MIKPNAKKVRRLGNGNVIGGFAGATADAFTLFERLESKLEQHQGQLMRAAVELAKDWRTDKYLRSLEAMMIVADKDVTLVLTGNGDVLEPEAGVAAIGSGGNFALAAARALFDNDKDAETIARQAMKSPPTSASTPTATSRSKRSEERGHGDGAILCLPADDCCRHAAGAALAGGAARRAMVARSRDTVNSSAAISMIPMRAVHRQHRWPALRLSAVLRSATGTSTFGPQPEGTRGIDQFIGEADMIERGHGSAFIRAFIDAAVRERRAAHGHRSRAGQSACHSRLRESGI